MAYSPLAYLIDQFLTVAWIVNSRMNISMYSRSFIKKLNLNLVIWIISLFVLICTWFIESKIEKHYMIVTHVRNSGRKFNHWNAFNFSLEVSIFPFEIFKVAIKIRMVNGTHEHTYNGVGFCPDFWLNDQGFIVISIFL